MYIYIIQYYVNLIMYNLLILNLKFKLEII